MADGVRGSGRVERDALMGRRADSPGPGHPSVDRGN